MSGEAEVERNNAVIRKLPALLDSLDPPILDRSAITALFTEDFQLHESTRPDWPRGHEGAIRLHWGTAARLPDGHPWRTV